MTHTHTHTQIDTHLGEHLGGEVVGELPVVDEDAVVHQLVAGAAVQEHLGGTVIFNKHFSITNMPGGGNIQLPLFNDTKFQ